jgi:hypothetical protein
MKVSVHRGRRLCFLHTCALYQDCVMVSESCLLLHHPPAPTPPLHPYPLLVHATPNSYKQTCRNSFAASCSIMHSWLPITPPYYHQASLEQQTKNNGVPAACTCTLSVLQLTSLLLSACYDNRWQSKKQLQNIPSHLMLCRRNSKLVYLQNITWDVLQWKRQF